SSMIIGIRVEAENIQTGKIKHCTSSYFTMVAKDKDGKSVLVPGLILSTLNEVRRFHNCLKQIALKKERDYYEEVFDHSSEENLAILEKYNVLLELKKS
ncbi:MAG TPA: acyl-CoA thioesterase, partial [Flavobacterium sp.]